MLRCYDRYNTLTVKNVWENQAMRDCKKELITKATLTALLVSDYFGFYDHLEFFSVTYKLCSLIQWLFSYSVCLEMRAVVEYVSIHIKYD